MNKYELESYWTERPDGTVATIYHSPASAIRFEGVKRVENKKDYTATPYAPSTLEKILDEKATVLGKCSLAQWREWAGPVFTAKEIEEDCDECDGSGEAECDMGHFHDCEECNGTGTVTVEEDPPELPEIKIGDKHIDPAILSSILKLVEDTEATISMNDTKVFIEGSGWKIAAMCLIHEQSEKPVIEFHPH